MHSCRNNQRFQANSTVRQQLAYAWPARLFARANRSRAFDIAPQEMAPGRTASALSRFPCCPPALASTPSHASQVSAGNSASSPRSEEHTSELQSPCNLVCRLLLEKKKNNIKIHNTNQKNTIKNN